MKILFVGAHADDIEIGCGGTILKTLKKNSVINFIATDSEYFDENQNLIRSKKDAENDLKRCYKNTKVKRIEQDSFSNNPEIDLLCYKDNRIYDPEDKYKEMYNCGKQVLYNEYNCMPRTCFLGYCPH